MNSTKLITTYSKSLFENINSQSLDQSKNSFDVATITSLEQKSLFSTVYIIGEELLLIRSTLVSSKKLEDFFKNPTYAEKS